MRVLKIKGLPKKKWVDRDTIMLYACFQLLKDFVELEKGHTHVNYEYHKQFVDEVRFLYDWWEKRRGREDDVYEQVKEDDEMLERLIKIRTQLWT